jgi:hypothetical protein
VQNHRSAKDGLEKEKQGKEAKLKGDAAKQAADHAAFIASLPILSSPTASVFLASERKCLEEFLQASAMEEFEKRKRLAELLSITVAGLLITEFTFK